MMTAINIVLVIDVRELQLNGAYSAVYKGECKGHNG